MSVKHLVSIDDLTDTDLADLVDSGARFAAAPDDPRKVLSGRVVGLYFRLTSTRTRTSFWSGALRLGAGVVNFDPGSLQTATGETTEDTGRVFSSMLDVLVARTGGAPEEMRSWASWNRMSVINAMSGPEHPTQALTDLITLRAHFGDLRGLRVVYLGEGNNTAAAVALAFSRIPGLELELRTPPGYGVDPVIMEKAARSAERSGARVREVHHMRDLPGDVDAFYTTRWQTTGTSKPDPDWRARFAPFQVTEGLWERSPKAVFLHDLPAHRGEEVTAEVLDGPASLAFDQAANKMACAMAVLDWIRA
ncbi:ornithine carbamoyltransferase [Saccharomonospora cyanea]|uniref:Ornithine carbamoyltransferase n=1 Tax=Saccharomonospora cyanea NA-134 TaxID=882082 RepID=H5XI12_9PSEU|nr:ornithine carbamoyltransferase [Saccharomonospora cyanea]EHR60642.1 ornithine carbamoyltransferase [Saccharomonospora cyanea NA-134]